MAAFLLFYRKPEKKDSIEESVIEKQSFREHWIIMISWLVGTVVISALEIDILWIAPFVIAGAFVASSRLARIQSEEQQIAKAVKPEGSGTNTPIGSETSEGSKRNKFILGGKRHFTKGVWAVPNQAGVHLNTAMLDPEIGPEVAVFLSENRGFLNQLRQQGPFQLRLNAGAVNTSAGPVLFMLWWFPPLINKRPFAGYELLISPDQGDAGTELLEQASRQTHLHLVILDEKQEIFDVVEFENNYDLGRLAALASEIRPQLVGYDFNRARKAFLQEIPQESLLRC